MATALKQKMKLDKGAFFSMGKLSDESVEQNRKDIVTRFPSVT